MSIFRQESVDGFGIFFRIRFVVAFCCVGVVSFTGM